MRPNSPSPVAVQPPRKRTARRVLTALGVTALVACGLPAAWVGIRFLTFETGPIHQLPDVCSAVDNDALRDFIGDVPGHHERTGADDPEDSCRWSATGSSRTVTVTAVRYTRHWNESSLARADAMYHLDIWRYHGDDAEDAVLLGGDRDGLCIGGFDEDFVVTYHCVARVDNVVIDVEVVPVKESAVGEVDVDIVHANTAVLAGGLGRSLIEDVADDL